MMVDASLYAKSRDYYRGTVRYYYNCTMRRYVSNTRQRLYGEQVRCQR